MSIKTMFNGGRPDAKALILMIQDRLQEIRFYSRADAFEPDPSTWQNFEYARQLTREVLDLQALLIHELRQREQDEQTSKTLKQLR